MYHSARIMRLLADALLLVSAAGCGSEAPRQQGKEASTMNDKVQKTDDQWRQQLTQQQYHVCREKGTEPAFAGAYWDTKTKGVYKCVCCGQPLFDSQTKFDSGTGWPSFWAPVDKSSVGTRPDKSRGKVRTEITCSRCGAHLGHVFKDGPKPTGLRYCVNSASLKLEEKK